VTEEIIEKRGAEEDEEYKLPKLIYRTKVKSKEMFGCQIIILNKSRTTAHIIIYLHVGAYVEEITLPHIIFCDKLAKKTHPTVSTPIYPLAPNHTFEETYQIVENLYELLLKFEKPLTVMGDSAGGGLSAAFCEYLAANQIA
jgi:acetyl esterase/lipase